MNYSDDKIEDLLVDSDLAKQLVPNKFKFTSHQGRIRRQKLLMGAKKLSGTESINNITLVQVCAEAGIPRASAYHFFPNIEAIFLALRFLNAIEFLDEIKQVQTSNYDRWQGYLTAVVIKATEWLQSDSSKAKLVYEENTPDFLENEFGKKIESQVAQIIYDNISTQYEVPPLEKVEEMLIISYGIVDSVFRLSFRQHQHITEHYRKEAITACIAYMRCYLPETLARKS